MAVTWVHDALADGRPFRVLTGQSPIVDVASSMSGLTVGLALDRALAQGTAPKSITVDHGTEFMSRALEDWASHRGVQLDCLNVHQFTSTEDANVQIEVWRGDYNERRPHSALGHLTPNEYADQRRETAV